MLLLAGLENLVSLLQFREHLDMRLQARFRILKFLTQVIIVRMISKDAQEHAVYLRLCEPSSHTHAEALSLYNSMLKLS